MHLLASSWFFGMRGAADLAGTTLRGRAADTRGGEFSFSSSVVSSSSSSSSSSPKLKSDALAGFSLSDESESVHKLPNAL